MMVLECPCLLLAASVSGDRHHPCAPPRAPASAAVVIGLHASQWRWRSRPTCQALWAGATALSSLRYAHDATRLCIMLVVMPVRSACKVRTATVLYNH